jgi:hypothetical protein
MTKKTFDGRPTRDDRVPAMPPELSTLRMRVPADLLRVARQRAAFTAMTLDEFIQEAIEERLRSFS